MYKFLRAKSLRACYVVDDLGTFFGREVDVDIHFSRAPFDGSLAGSVHFSVESLTCRPVEIVGQQMACLHTDVASYLAKVLMMQAAVEHSHVTDLVIYGIVEELYFVFNEAYPRIVNGITCSESCDTGLPVSCYIARKVEFLQVAPQP